MVCPACFHYHFFGQAVDRICIMTQGFFCMWFSKIMSTELRHRVENWVRSHGLDWGLREVSLTERERLCESAGSGIKRKYHREREFTARMKALGSNPSPTASLLWDTSNFLGLPMSQWSPLWKEKREGSWKVNSNLQNFYYILNLCNMHPRHSLNLINTATLGSLYLYSTDEKSETTVIGESILLPWDHTMRMSHTGSGNERCVWMRPQMHTTSLESILTGFRT